MVLEWNERQARNFLEHFSHSHPEYRQLSITTNPHFIGKLEKELDRKKFRFYPLEEDFCPYIESRRVIYDCQDKECSIYILRSGHIKYGEVIQFMRELEEGGICSSFMKDFR